MTGLSPRPIPGQKGGEYVLHLGGVNVRMLHVGPAHTGGDTVFFVEGEGVLYAGDA